MSLQSLSFDPNGRSAYVLAWTNGISGYELRPYHVEAGGRLAGPTAPPATVSEGEIAPDVRITPRTAYFVSRKGVWQFRRSAAGGLTPLTPPCVTTGRSVEVHDLRREVTKPGDKVASFEVERGDFLAPISLVLDPAARIAYVLNREYYYKGTEVVTSSGSHGSSRDVDVAHSVVRLRMEADGSLVPMSVPAVSVDTGVSSLSLSPDGHTLYAVDAGHQRVVGYRASADGALTPSPSPPVPGRSIAFNPAVGVAYVARDGQIDQYRVSPDGALTPVSPASVAVPTARLIGGVRTPVRALCVDSGNRCLFAWYDHGGGYTVVAAYPIRAGGTLAASPVTTVPVGIWYGTAQMAVLPSPTPLPPRRRPAPVSPETKRAPQGEEFAYALNSEDVTISQYRVGRGGALRPLTPPAVKAGSSPFLTGESDLCADPAGRFLYVSSGFAPAKVSQFRIRADGTLSPLSPPEITLPSGASVGSIAIDGAGRFAYAGDRNGARVYAFTVNADGTLSANPAHDMEVSPSLSRLYLNRSARMLLVLHDNNYLDSYRIGPDGGLTYLARFQPNLSQPFAFDVSGRFAFYGDGYGQIWQYRFAPNGALSENIPRAVPAGGRPESVAVTPDGRFAYAANRGDFPGDGSVSGYRLDPEGHLTALRPSSVLTGTSPCLVTVVPSGRFLYAVSPGQGLDAPARPSPPISVISQYRVGPDGGLSALTPPAVVAGRDVSRFVVVRRH